MEKKTKHPRTTAILLILSAAAVLTGFIATQVELVYTGRWEGAFLLKGRDGRLFELTDDIYLGDGPRLIVSAPLWWMKTYRSYEKFDKEAPCLYYEWDEGQGRGFVRNFLPGGGRISTSFSRFNYAGDAGETDDALDMHGLFVGGGLPVTVSSDNATVLDETGMAYWDGKRWHHLWCSVNEGIVSAQTQKAIPPSGWRYLGSRVLQGSRESLAITSSHEIPVDGQPLRMDRYAYFRAGETYFVLSVRIRNEGNAPAEYYYVYGDEPWVGEFGSSEGNVGWVKDSVMTDTGLIDTSKYSFAGFLDYAVGASHEYAGTANFIEWFGENTPVVYFANSPERVPQRTGQGEPLSGDARFIGLQWGPVRLAPGETVSYVMAIGMANSDPRTGLPVKPDIGLDRVPR